MLTTVGEASERQQLIAALQQLNDSISKALDIITEAASEPAQAKPLLVSIRDAARVLNVGESRIKQYCYAGTLDSVKIGSRRLIPYESLQALTKQLIIEQAS